MSFSSFRLSESINKSTRKEAHLSIFSLLFYSTLFRQLNQNVIQISTSVLAFSHNPTRHISFGVRKIKEEVVKRVLTWSRLGGPGSLPPTCRSKCGKCLPCKLVCVPI